MSYEVTLKQVPAQWVASWTTQTSLASIGDDVGRGFATVAGALAAAGAEPAGPPFVLYVDSIDEQAGGRIEVCIPAPPGAEGRGSEVQWREVPGGTVASATHHGPYDQISAAYDTLGGWVPEHGRRVTGPPREIYLSDPQHVPAEELLTEVQFPVGALA